MATKFTGAVFKRVPETAVESIRRNHEQRLSEVQTAVQAVEAAPGRLLARQTLTSSGTYTPTKGASSGYFRMCGGGGGGGGAAAAPGVVSLAGGGASGITVEFAVSALGPGGTVVIGAAGAGGAAAAGNGGTGGDTTLTIGGQTYTAKGGFGGAGGAQNGAVGAAPGGSPQTGSTSGLPQAGMPGEHGLIFSAA